MNLLLRTLLLVVLAWSLRIGDGMCTGIAVSNVSLGTLNSGTGNAAVNFDISWDNSWRSTDSGAPAPNNWDAAWVFVKFRKNGDAWSRASLNDSGHTVPSGASLSVGLVDTASSFNLASNPGVGVFIYRSADGTGTFSKSGFSLVWKFAQDGVSSSDTVDIRVIAIEMVYVPDGSFFVGDNGYSTGSLRQGASDSDPWYIGSEDAISTGSQSGSGAGVGETLAEYYYMRGAGTPDDASGSSFTIPAPFPKGYRRFYVMKGEISQSQWVAFFNTLTDTQKGARDITSSSGKNTDNVSYRNNVSWTSGDATLPDRGSGATYASVAMNYLSWADLTAYLDWAGLRPMSDLEFERAARGPYRSVSGEYVWGTNSYTQATSISNGGTASEVPGAAANYVGANSPGVQGPMRVGAMASGDATRVEAGAGYYGALDLSGNANERSVSVGVSTGRAFEGRYHGDGILDSSGDPNVSTWPVSDAVGTGIRGGNWLTGGLQARTSDRRFASTPYTTRLNTYGGRGVRLAP